MQTTIGTAMLFYFFCLPANEASSEGAERSGVQAHRPMYLFEFVLQESGWDGGKGFRLKGLRMAL